MPHRLHVIHHYYFVPNNDLCETRERILQESKFQKGEKLQKNVQDILGKAAREVYLCEQWLKLKLFWDAMQDYANTRNSLITTEGEHLFSFFLPSSSKATHKNQLEQNNITI